MDNKNLSIISVSHLVMKNQRGLSLVELMISLVLGLIIVGAAMATFLSSKQTYNLQEAMSRVNESGRFALDIISNDLRMAGLSDTRSSNPPVRGYAQGAVGSKPAGVVLSSANSQVLLIRPHDRLSEIMNSGAGTGYGTSFYVAPDSASGLPSLYRGTEPMVEGVQDVRFTYGLDADSDDQIDGAFVEAAAVVNWQDLIAVRVSILAAAGQGNVVEEPQQLPAPFSVTAADNRYYQVFSSTVALRNVRLDKPDE